MIEISSPNARKQILSLRICSHFANILGFHFLLHMKQTPFCPNVHLRPWKLKMENPSKLRTFIAQLSICFALYLVLNIGEPQNKIYERSERRALDLYFISVIGGFRPFGEQTLLLKQMEKIAKALKVKFVVNISNMGENNPFKQNGTKLFSALKVPWYNTPNSKEDGIFYFREQISVPFGKTLDIVGIDTDPLQDSTDDTGENHLLWLKSRMDTLNGTWRIVFGLHPLVLCEKTSSQQEENQVFEPLHRIFTKYGVNAYISGCSCSYHIRIGNVDYISNPGPLENEKSTSTVNLVDGFLLHRASSLEIETYHITTDGTAVYRTRLQSGVAAM